MSVAKSAKARGRKVAVESTLFLGQSSDGGLLQWEPFHAVHHSDGAVSLRPINPATKGEEGPRDSSEDGFLLGADWRQPFTVAPWAPLSAPIKNIKNAAALLPPGPIDVQNGLQRLRNSADVEDGVPLSGDRRLYPFSLSYVPLATQMGPGGREKASYRTLLLAAGSGKERGKWLSALERKATTPGLRGAAATPSVAPVDLALAVPPERRCLATVGEELSGLSVAAAPSSALRKPFASAVRLNSGHAGLWSHHTRLHIVKDLYDEYAADPISANPLLRSSSSSSHNKPNRQTTPSTPGGDMDAAISMGSASSTGRPNADHRHMQFFVKYVKQQAKIENLLEQTWRSSGPARRTPGSADLLQEEPPGWKKRSSSPKPWLQRPRPLSRSATEPGTGTLRQTAGSKETATPPPASAAPKAAVTSTDAEASGSIHPSAASMTPNVTLREGVLSNVQWSGGIIFETPISTFGKELTEATQERSQRQTFNFKITPQLPLDRYPLFFGVVPAGTDLHKVNLFHTGDGVFLCVGGQASIESSVAGLGVGEPCIYSPSGRRPVELPGLSDGGSFVVRFQSMEKAKDQHVFFALEDPHGNEIGQAQQSLPKRSRRTQWQPCVLLSHPDSCVHVAYT